MVAVIAALSDELVTHSGPDQVAACLAAIGRSLGAELQARVAETCGAPRALADLLAEVMTRIGGRFTVVAVTDDEIVLDGTRCPFHPIIPGRPALCGMTVSILTVLAEEAAGGAEVEILRSIPRGDAGCRVAIRLGRADVAAE